VTRNDPGEFLAFEAAAWDRIPQRYDAFFSPITSRAIEPLLDAAAVTAGTRLLDVATGPGHVAVSAALRGAVVHGVDVAPAMVALAARHCPAAAFSVAAAEALPFIAGAFDAVVSNFGLGHFAEPERVMAELVRVLSPGGRIALGWWAEPDHARVLGVFHQAIAEAKAVPPPDLPPGPPFFRYSVGTELTGLLASAGLDSIELRRVAFVQRLASAGELWERVVSSSVRTAAVILGQPEAVQLRIRDAYERLVAPYHAAGGLEIPVALIIGAGSKARHARGNAPYHGSQEPR
jgi:SAM-dependent methyltransferase